MRSNRNLIAFRVSDMLPELTARSRDSENRSDLARTARRDLERYYCLLAEELQDLRFSVRFSEAEASLIVDACNRLLVEPHTVQLLWARVDDAIRLNGYDAKWGVDSPALIEKLRGLSYAQTLAIQDAAERWWLRRDDWQTHAEGLRVIGLLR